MTDKAVVKWPIMQMSTLLRLKHCLRRHIERTARNEFKRRFSHFLATFRATIGSVSQQTLRTAVCSQEFKMATKKSGQRNENEGRIRGNFAAALDRTENKLMWKYEHSWYLTETCQVYSYNVKEKCIKFPAIVGVFWNFGGGLKLHYKTIPPLYLRKSLLATAGNLKVNEQSKYKSGPFLFLSLGIERKPEKRELLNF